MKIAERVVMVLIFFAFVGGVAWLYFAVQYEQKEVREAVARGEYETSTSVETPDIAPEDWRVVYPNTVPIQIGAVTVEASVADSLYERIEGLSGTPFLPDHVVKLFVFGTSGNHPIWMKDMNYPIDILWVAKEGEIVHLEENVSPDTYSSENPAASQNFESPTPAWYVIETKAGFVANNTIAVGDKVSLYK